MALRVTGGELGGRIIRVPKAGVRPTQDRVRAAVFSSLAERIPGAKVLDLFAGSGAMGLEAYSRGAASVVWVEQNRRVLDVLRQNVRELCGSDAAGARETPGVLPAKPITRVVADDALRFLRNRKDVGLFDVIFADPPYDRDGQWFKKILCAVSEGSILSVSGLLVMEVSARVPAEGLLGVRMVSSEGWQLVKARVYGETRICMLYPTRSEASERGATQERGISS